MGTKKVKLKVKALQDGFAYEQRIKKGTIFFIKDEAHFSHLWMRALDWQPAPPSPQVAKLMDSPEHKNKFKKFVPFDARTHGKVNAAKLEGEEDDEEEDEVISQETEAEEEQAEEQVKKGKGKRTGGDVI